MDQAVGGAAKTKAAASLRNDISDRNQSGWTMTEEVLLFVEDQECPNVPEFLGGRRKDWSGRCPWFALVASQ